MKQVSEIKTKRSDLLKHRIQVIYAMMIYTDVLCVSIGFKEVGGLYTKELAYKIYVKKKFSLDELPVDQHIPKKYKGFPTDVVEMVQNRD